MNEITHVSSNLDVEVANSQEAMPPANVQEFNQEKCKTKDSPEYELASDKKDIKSFIFHFFSFFFHGWEETLIPRFRISTTGIS